jgi:hypothetical protein
MSEKASKGYDPTQARMVGNIIAGMGSEYFHPTISDDSRKTLRKKIIEETNDVIKALRKQFKEESE